MRDDAAPGRPRQFDETVKLREIMKLFWKVGYEGASLSDIMAATGLKKGSLYAAYGDKRMMYAKALSQYDADIVDEAARLLENRSLPPRQRLETFLSAPVADVERGRRDGCFLCNASADQADLHCSTKAQVGRSFDRLTKGLIAALADLHPGEPQEPIVPKARLLLSLYIGLRIMARTGSPAAQLGLIVRQAMKMIQEK